MSDREGFLKRRDQLLMQDERIAELEAAIIALSTTVNCFACHGDTYTVDSDEYEALIRLLPPKEGSSDA